MGRNCRLTPELQKRICELIKLGNYSKVSAKACGICEGTFYLWLKKGTESKSGKFFEFNKAITRARAEFETTAVKEIGTKYKSWLLERRHPERWGRKDFQKVEHSGKVDISIFKEYLKDEEEQ